MRLATLMLVSLISVFGTLAFADGGSGERSFKGWELYAWHDAGCADSTCFALVPGTNRNKTADEVRRAPLDITALEARIGKLAGGEEVFWLAPDPSFLVPEHARPVTDPARRAVAACARQGVKLSLPAR